MPNDKIKIAIGADHAGFEFKEMLKKFLYDYEVEDFGTHTLDSVDYPDFAHPVASAVENGNCKYGILLCGSANGVAITANKHQHIRAGLCWVNEVASLVRKHNDANVLCIPARFVSEEEAKEITTTFLNTEFEGGRHQNRVNKISC
ncbi:ribose 5-phosphate isomerase B [Pedobacter jejuensis]|uniref:Ribose 5-phosphate isomerase B n=1 Tax=Pedobacter jejuensis TaxID=1268550 RepID=A0A3N0C044_9SPHI|nr:ribose 5-phosphate isomerase B [Pedobacter jejuensis]RNL55119.1 ribose 5-phosphate isomerase B [Pedobacter jejuensis]